MKVNSSRSEDGFVLILVLGVIAVITAVSVGGYAVAQQTLHNSQNVNSQNLAFQAASTGLDQELATFDPANVTAGAYPKPLTLGNGATAVVSVTGSGDDFELVSVGASSGQNETVSMRFRYVNLWDMNISGGEGTFAANGFKGNSTIFGQLYVKGDAVQGGNSKIFGGPVYYTPSNPGDEWTVQNNSAGIGSPSQPVQFFGTPAGTTRDYYLTMAGAPPQFDQPTLDATDMSKYGTKAQTWGVRNPASLLTLSGGAVDTVLLNGATLLRFHPGPNGETPVIYSDAPITIPAGIAGFTGKGILVSNGDFTVAGDFLPYDAAGNRLVDYVTLGPADGGTTWVNPPKMTGESVVGLLGTGDVILQNAGNGVCGAIICNGDFTVSANHSRFRGSAIAGFLNIDANNGFFANQTGLGAVVSGAMPEMPPLDGILATYPWVRR